MGRPIDADVLIHELKNSHYPGEPDVNAGIGIAIGKVWDAPTIELRCEECEAFNKTRLLIPQPERKSGHWIIYTVSMLDGEDCKCSECGQISCAPHWNFCPNCGTKMEGVRSDGSD